MLKKIAPLILCVLAAFTFSACSGKDKPAGEETPQPTKSQVIVTQKPAPSAQTAEPTPSDMPKPTEKILHPTIAPGNETYAGDIISQDAFSYAFETTGKTNEHRAVNQSVAIQFFATVEFNSLSLNCPSYGDNTGTLDFALYKWMGTYENTISEENTPAAVVNFTNFADNAENKMEFEALPDGEYLLYITSPDSTEGVGIWGRSELEGEPETRLYIDDEEETTGFELGPCAMPLKINYVKTPTVKAGPLQPSGL